MKINQAQHSQTSRAAPRLTSRRASAGVGLVGALALYAAGCNTIPSNQPPQIGDIEWPQNAVNAGYASPADVASGDEVAHVQVRDTDSPLVFGGARFFLRGTQTPADDDLRVRLIGTQQDSTTTRYRLEIWSPKQEGPQEGNYTLRFTATDGAESRIYGFLLGPFVPVVTPLHPLDTGNVVSREFDYSILRVGSSGNGNGGNPPTPPPAQNPDFIFYDDTGNVIAPITNNGVQTNAVSVPANYNSAVTVVPVNMPYPNDYTLDLLVENSTCAPQPGFDAARTGVLVDGSMRIDFYGICPGTNATLRVTKNKGLPDQYHEDIALTVTN